MKTDGHHPDGLAHVLFEGKSNRFVLTKIGKINQLEILRDTPYGFFLDGKEEGDVLLPKKYATPEMQVGDILDVFVYLDSEDRAVATTQTPLAEVGDFALLTAVDVASTGAFLDWGLQKDLFIPYGEQSSPVVVGRSYIVGVYLDNTGRIAASSKLEKFISPYPADFKEGQAVECFVCERTDLGFNAIVEKQKWGLIYENEIFQDLKSGQTITAFIKKIREDGKIDLSIKKPNFEKSPALFDAIIAHLKNHDGHSSLTDKSKPAEIYETFGVSKSQFKNAIGMLYRQKRIVIEKSGITLLKE